MGDQVAIAVIGAVAVILAALVGRVSFQVGKVRKDASVTREQVANDHSKNLRVEQDERHAENTAAILDLRQGLRALGTTVTREFEMMHELITRDRARIEEIENTGSRPGNGRHRL